MSTKKETDMSTEEETELKKAPAAPEEDTELKKAPAAPIDPDKDKVDFYAFKDNDKYKDDIFVAVNGKTFKIQRGKHVRIPRYVAEVLANSMDQDARTANLMEKEAGAYNIASKANII